MSPSGTDTARGGWLGAWTYAHRGLHGAAGEGGAAENSPEAFAGAIARGLGIECDVQVTRDGRAVVFHDWDLDRLTGETGAVRERDADTLAGIALSDSADTIPTLEAVLAQVAGRVPVLIEVKSKRAIDPAPLCAAVKAALAGYTGDVAVMSFDPRVPHWFHRHAPATVRGLVVTEEGKGEALGPVERRLAVAHAKPDFLACDVRDLPSRFASAHRAKGMPVLTWTVRTPELRERALRHADAAIAEGAGLA